MPGGRQLPLLGRPPFRFPVFCRRENGGNPMNKPIHLTTPLSAEEVRKLKVNDIVTLTGTIYTARDMAHLKLRELKESGKPLPEPLEGSVIFHAGPVVKKADGG